MKIGADGMQIKTKCVMNKKQLIKKSTAIMEGHECTITASVTARMLSVDVPDRDVKIDISLADIMHVMNATNAKYRELRKAELGVSVQQYK